MMTAQMDWRHWWGIGSAGREGFGQEPKYALQVGVWGLAEESGWLHRVTGPLGSGYILLLDSEVARLASDIHCEGWYTNFEQALVAENLSQKEPAKKNPIEN